MKIKYLIEELQRLPQDDDITISGKEMEIVRKNDKGQRWEINSEAIDDLKIEVVELKDEIDKVENEAVELNDKIDAVISDARKDCKYALDVFSNALDKMAAINTNPKTAIS